MNNQNDCTDFCYECQDSSEYICKICGHGYCQDCGSWATKENGVVCIKCMDELLALYREATELDYNDNSGGYIAPKEKA